MKKSCRFECISTDKSLIIYDEKYGAPGKLVSLKKVARQQAYRTFTKRQSTNN